MVSVRRLLLLLSALILASVVSASAEITLKGGLFNSLRYSVDGEEYHTVSNSGKELLQIMEGNPIAQSAVRKYGSRRRTAIVLGLVGGASLGWPIGWVAGGGEWEDYHTVMIGAGVILGLASVLTESSAISHLREGVQIYNQELRHTSLDNWPPRHAMRAAPPAFRIGISLSL